MQFTRVTADQERRDIPECFAQTPWNIAVLPQMIHDAELVLKGDVDNPVPEEYHGNHAT